jgi:hypothetical protein
MHSDWFNGIDILQGRWQYGEKVGYCYPSGLEKTLYKWEVYVPLVTKGLTPLHEKKVSVKHSFRNSLVNLRRQVFVSKFSCHFLSLKITAMEF